MREPNVVYKFRHICLHAVKRFQKTNPEEGNTGIEFALSISVSLSVGRIMSKDGRKERMYSLREGLRKRV